MRTWKGPMRKASGPMLIFLLAAYLGAATQPVEWRVEVVDPTATGKYSQLRMDTLGNAHVAYWDGGRDNMLKYAFWDRNLRKWFTQTLDRSGGHSSMVLDSKGHPNISYGDYGTASLKYIHWDGSGWQKQNIQINAKDISFYSSITLDLKDNPRISFYEYWGTGENYLLHLRNVFFNGQFWEVATIDPTPGSGKMNSIATDSKGNPHVLYANVKSENASLRYASWNGKSWDVEILEGAAKPYGVANVALILDKEDTPHITYGDAEKNLIKYATRRNGRWDIQVVDSVTELTFPDRNGIALDEQGNPYISYVDVRNQTVKMAYRRNQRWTAEIVDQNVSGFTPSLQIDRGVIWIAYADEFARVLKCARRPLDLPTASVRLTTPEPSTK